MDWRDRIVADPDVLVGKPVIKGTRISVELVMDLLAGGYTTDQILHQYDYLSREGRAKHPADTQLRQQRANSDYC